MVKRDVDINILKSVKKYIKEISKHYSIQEVYLFGSYAKGTNHEDSDIDVAVVVPRSSISDDILKDMARLYTLDKK